MSLLKVSLIPILFINIHAFNKTCETNKECAGERLECPNNEENCYINCVGFKSCEGTLVDCGTSMDCNLECSGYMSCDGLSIICPPHNICNIKCVSEEKNTCSDINITSSTNTMTTIKCAGDDACYGSNIHCADSDQCNLECFGERACSGPSSAPFTIYGERCNNLTISECIGDTESCKDLNVFCPSNVNDNPRCFLPGKGIFNERNAHDNEIKSGGINIYAVHSWHDVLITENNADNLISGTMFCGKNSNISCNITHSKHNNGSWDCIDDTSLCSTKVYQEPTMEPTMEPTYNPTGNPTVNPTIDPTDSPTEEPTLDPTDDPTTEPTKPTSLPTLSPTIEPTTDPTSITSQQSTEYGLLVAIILFVIFICLIICGWRYWNKGNDLDYTQKGRKKRNDKKIQLNADESDSMEDNDEDVMCIPMIETKNDGKKTKKRMKKNKVTMDENNAGDYQKQTDNPFEFNQWTELTQFD